MSKDKYQLIIHTKYPDTLYISKDTVSCSSWEINIECNISFGLENIFVTVC